MITRQEIKNAVPHGYAKKIAKRANVTPKAVSDYMGGKTNSKRVETATLEILAELQKSKQELNNRFLSVMA